MGNINAGKKMNPVYSSRKCGDLKSEILVEFKN